MKRLLFAFAIVLSLFTVACGKNETKAEQAELEAVIQHNLKAMNDEDLEAYMSDIYIGADPTLVTSTRALMEAAFEEFDLSNKIISFKVISCDGDNAVVEVVQETKKIKGPAFQDNRTTVEHTMKKTADGWKLFKTKLKKAEML